MPIEIQLACRTLAEFVHRSGGLSPISFAPFDAAAGTRTHQAFYKALEDYIPGATARSEVMVKGRYEANDLSLILNGRADMVVDAPNREPFALEVKTVGVPLSKVNDRGQLEHWAQVKIYAWLLAENDGQARASDALIHFALAYISREDMSCLLLHDAVTYAELKAWFEETCQAYVGFAKKQHEYKERSIESIKGLRFPYPSLRDGQRTFMENVLRHIRSRTTLLVQAPTGTGKTMSTLYPAVKAMAAGVNKQIFYLTAKSSTREVAAESVRALRKSGAIIRSLVMTAKEKLCLEPDLYCDPTRCPYAQNYYKNINAALDDALSAQEFDSELILQLARKHKVCPFELQLDIARYVDIVICDYNYAFDPRVKLDRFFTETIDHYTLLIDEAHNLPDRARSMYSATLTEKQLLTAAKALKRLDTRHAGILYPIIHYFTQIRNGIKPPIVNNKLPQLEDPAKTNNENSYEINSLEEEKRLAALPLVEPEIKAHQVMSQGLFRGAPAAPKELIRKLWFVCHQLRDILEDIDDFQLNQDILDFYFDARFFLRVSEEFWSNRYILSAQIAADGLEITELCLDSSDQIVSIFRNRHSAVFFSATLTPLEYFTREFCGSNYDDKPDSMVLASPFPQENLLLAVASGIQTTYKERRTSQNNLARTIALALIRAGGNSMVFFPSYSYMNQIVPTVRQIVEKHSIDISVQRPGMSDREREAYLAQFNNLGQARSLAAFAVMGGVFGEGIDLVGEQLKAVIIVGTGIPQVSPEREILQQYYGELSLGGFNFAYLYPGFNKVMQAAGRLIRSEEDTGLILLIDERYERPEYRMLFPEEWIPVYCSNLRELNDALDSNPALINPAD